MHGGLAFINSRDEWNEKLRSRVSRQFSFPMQSDDAPCELLPSDFYLKIQVPEAGEMESRLIGKYNFHNLAMALAVARFYGIHSTEALKTVCSYEPGNNRSQLIQTERNRLISDAYNANPSSVLAALENLAEMQVSGKVAILGDMLELGEDSRKEHALLGTWAAEHPEIQFLVLGKEMAAFSAACPAASHFPEKPDLETFLLNEHFKEKTILLKGSRGMKLESLLPLL
jgi:UDP-N-acetylmuramoyl-tripeptide--D-alanyl-D-alanine ligase